MILGTAPKQGFTSGKELILFLLSVPCWLALAGLYGLYEGDRLRADTTTLDDFWPLFHAITVGVWLAFVASRLTDTVRASERRLILFWFLALVILPLGRVIMRVFIRSRVAFLQRTLIVGAGLVGQEIARKIQRNPGYGLELAGLRRQRSAAAAPRAGRHPGAGRDRRSQRDRARVRDRARDAGIHR